MKTVTVAIEIVALPCIFSKQSARTNAHWRKLTHDDGTLLIPLIVLFRLESLPFLST